MYLLETIHTLLANNWRVWASLSIIVSGDAPSVSRDFTIISPKVSRAANSSLMLIISGLPATLAQLDGMNELGLTCSPYLTCFAFGGNGARCTNQSQPTPGA
jgi:hypothetical protein